ncbi:SCO7613 C-terminal domain-containing membrane protein, partial [Streptomyces massasporeus]
MARTAEVWSGEHAGLALTSYPGTAALVLAVAAAVLAAVPRLWARGGSLALVWALLTALPVSLALPYAATLALQLLTTAAALACAVRPGPLTRGLRRPEPAGGPGTPQPEPATAAPAAPAAPGAPWGTWAPSQPRPQAPAEPGTVLGWIAYAGGLMSALSAAALAL